MVSGWTTWRNALSLRAVRVLQTFEPQVHKSTGSRAVAEGEGHCGVSALDSKWQEASLDSRAKAQTFQLVKALKNVFKVIGAMTDRLTRAFRARAT
jgi:hypothetical protein